MAKQSTHQIQESLALAIEQIPSSIQITDADGLLLYVNESFCRITGYSSEEVLGSDSSFLKSGLHSSGFYRELWKTLSSGNSWQGEFCNRKKDGRIFWQASSITPVTDPGGDIIYFVAISEDITDKKRQEEEILHLALYDNLTNLPNRILLQDRVKIAIARAKREDEKVAIAMIDLDRFKPINDNFGHKAGDKTLQTISNRIAALIRETDTIARVGGDEFVLVMPGIRDCTIVPDKLEEISRELSKPIAVSGQMISLDCSWGCALFPEDGGDIETLVDAADRDMYIMKQKHHS